LNFCRFFCPLIFYHYTADDSCRQYEKWMDEMSPPFGFAQGRLFGALKKNGGINLSMAGVCPPTLFELRRDRHPRRLSFQPAGLVEFFCLRICSTPLGSGVWSAILYHGFRSLRSLHPRLLLLKPLRGYGVFLFKSILRFAQNDMPWLNHSCYLLLRSPFSATTSISKSSGVSLSFLENAPSLAPKISMVL
jgi:hypothetical protein